MKPSQVVSKLHQIATAIENSKRPDKNLISEDLGEIIIAISKKAGNRYFLVHVHGDESGVSLEETNITPPDGKFMDIGIPNSYDALFVASLDLLRDPNFVKDHIPSHLYQELEEAVLGY